MVPAQTENETIKSLQNHFIITCRVEFWVAASSNFISETEHKKQRQYYSKISSMIILWLDFRGTLPLVLSEKRLRYSVTSGEQLALLRLLQRYIWVKNSFWTWELNLFSWFSIERGNNNHLLIQTLQTISWLFVSLQHLKMQPRWSLQTGCASTQKHCKLKQNVANKYY